MAKDFASKTDNPLRTGELLPRFSKIAAGHVVPAVSEVLAEQRAAVASLESTPIPDLTWLQALESVHEAVARVWGPVSHLNAVLSSDDLRDAYNECVPLISEFYTELGQSKALYRHFLTLSEAGPWQDKTVRQILKLGIRDFKLAGVALEGEDRDRFKEISTALAERQARFEQNLMDATDAYTYHATDESGLRGIPAVAMHRAAATAREEGLEGWLFRLDAPTYQAIITHADDRRLRERFYEAWNTRASDTGPYAGKWDNGPLIEEILALRLEAARLLGFGSFAEESLAAKMAQSTEEVVDFLRDLGARTRNLAASELARLQALADVEIEAWDVAYYSEELKQKTLNLSDEDLRPYFPLDGVLNGLFRLAERLYGIRISARPGHEVWHETVRYFRIEDAGGAQLGGLFTDLYARSNKRGGAWMDACVNRSMIGPSPQRPVAYLVCNFSPPIESTPSLLTHSDIVTLFHEFGHSLHHLLTEVEYPSLAGINGVAWDAVELPSQFFENYAYEPEVLSEIASHYLTGQALSAEKIAKLQQSRRFLAGLAMVRQLEFALFDLLLHDRRTPTTLRQMRDLHDRVRQEVAVIEPPPYSRFPNSFSHIFGGGYAAGYYSYKWAEVLAADAFAAFGSTGPYDSDTARRFRRSILATGGSVDALDAFIEFRGREPQIEALLRQSGIEREATT